MPNIIDLKLNHVNYQLTLQDLNLTSKLEGLHIIGQDFLGYNLPISLKKLSYEKVGSISHFTNLTELRCANSWSTCHDFPPYNIKVFFFLHVVFSLVRD